MGGTEELPSNAHILSLSKRSIKPNLLIYKPDLSFIKGRSGLASLDDAPSDHIIAFIEYSTLTWRDPFRFFKEAHFHSIASREDGGLAALVLVADLGQYVHF